MRTFPKLVAVAALASVAACESSGEPKAAEQTAGAVASGEDDEDDAPVTDGDADPQPDEQERDSAQDEEGGAEPEVPAEPAGPPKPPEGYGLFKPSAEPPAEEDLVIHALAGYEVVAVYDEPKMDGRKLGFLRIGHRTKVTEKVGTSDCAKGWYQLPSGGYACASKGLVVDRDREPYMIEPPPPALDQPFPYEWSYVRKWNSPMYWRPPNATEKAEAAARRAVLEAERKGEPPPGSEPPPAAGTGGSGEGGGGDDALPAVGDPPDDGPDDGPPDDAPPDEVPPDDAPPDDGPPDDAPPDEPEEEEEPIKLPLNPQHPWLEKGYFISLAGTEKEGSTKYWKTARGGFVAQSDAFKYEPKDYAGSEIPEGTGFPFGFIMTKKGAPVYELEEDDKLKRVDKLEKRTFVNLTEEVEIGGKTYMVTTEGKYIKKDVIRLAEPQPLPKGLEPYDRWIDVSKTKQILVAYEGERPVYSTLVSTGRKGTDEEPFETPVGRWRVYSKQVTSNMDGTTATDGNYAIQDVPWVMYFEGSYALHGAFWHRSFGSVRSHGCVNLGPSDARFLFFWTTPFLPEGWHGVHSSDDNPGTTIVVHE